MTESKFPASEVACCPYREGQPATSTLTPATRNETSNATDVYKSLAAKVLSRHRDATTHTTKGQQNGCIPPVSEGGKSCIDIKPEQEPLRRHAYHFRLRNGEGGGTYLTEAASVDEARRELLKRFGGRLRMVTTRGSEP